ncbi:MAG TPA: hypothetical protein VK504_02240 [Vicinamibacterales bacterium]|jgi:hypothetical protein|nr:hypothetical protein [Vicinamibacterales bacterium]
MMCLVQVAAEPERCTRLAGRLTAVQLDERLRACALRRLSSISPISFRSTPRWLTPPLAANGAELVGVSDYPGRMTVSM